MSPARRRRRPGAAVAVVLSAAVVLVLAPASATADSGLAPERASRATVVWSDCGDSYLRDNGYDCARLAVPADRDDPSGATFSLALVRHRSTGSADQRIGSLVFNPGGPGGSGLDAIPGVWPTLPDEVRQRFDLVTWDPRGIGQSRPALRDCATPWPERPVSGPVDWARVVRDFRRTLASANRACQAANQGVIEQLSTVENVEDLERIRVALGDDQLTYWGMSYGTRIGYVYALRHPDRVRAMVLDGSIDPSSTLLGLAEGGAAPDQAYGSFADVYPIADRQLRELLARLDTGPAALPNGVDLTRWDVRDAVFNAVSSQAAYAEIAKIIGTWHTAVLGTGAEQEKAAQAAAPLTSVLRSLPNSNAGGMFSVVNCLDYAGRPSLARTQAAVRAQVRLGPQYGGSLATMYALTCAGLRIKPDPVPIITGEGSDVPVLILGASRDGSTIVQWTTRMSRAFPQSRTVTYAGGQHVTWTFAGSACVNAIANRYVLTRNLPATDRACPNVATP